jgi:hypothetical protein
MCLGFPMAMEGTMGRQRRGVLMATIGVSDRLEIN